VTHEELLDLVRAYDSGRFSAKRENGVYHFQQLVREFVAA
jgi:hypothetical protein